MKRLPLLLLLLPLAGCSSQPVAKPPHEFADDLPQVTYREEAGSVFDEVQLYTDEAGEYHGSFLESGGVRVEPQGAALGAEVEVVVEVKTNPYASRVRVALFELQAHTREGMEAALAGEPVAEADGVPDGPRSWRATFKRTLTPEIVKPNELLGQCAVWGVSILLTDVDHCVDRQVFETTEAGKE